MDQTSSQIERRSDLESPFGEQPLDATAVENCADRLSRLTERMVSFLQTHLSRLQDAALAMDAFSQQMAEFEVKSEEFHQRQADWEQQKERENTQMAEDARLLSQAWDRIEMERRENLTMGSAIEMSVMDAPVNQTVSLREEKPAQPSLTDTDLFDLGIPTLTQTPAMEFQQLRREIRQHSQRKR